ncbi:TonB-dependent siderophore receptor [Hyphomicrobium sp. LHD-15]|uniref:TonB-dependent siderophore receptor n=1 Tax=Hyphomicrobium sp. LHD-15 TaxID=3072142 RepID=UPI00280FC509|nr:TonB-dependent siderophore receptor [Hyphomicrobium sp. LHD-15]MDQ8697309.1 TonB-dependent siderophore receptor [Hyphomicrobium sp. LHD-15]
MNISTLKRASMVLPIMLSLGAEAAFSQDAGPAAAPAKQDPASTALPPLEVTTSGAKKAKAQKKTKTPPSQTTSTAAQAEPSAPKPSDGSSTRAGAVNGYVVKDGTVGTKTDTPLQEVPQSISTVTRQQLEDRKPLSLGDSLAYVPGVRINQSGFDPRFDSFYIRGFDATNTGVYRDGLRQLNSGFGQFKTEMYGLDSVTALRGPSGALYGSSNAGGIIDMYTKRPTETPFNEVEYVMGNHDRFQGNFDFSGPAPSNNNVLYRFTGVVRDSDTQYWGIPDDRIYLAPAFTFKIDSDTKLTVFGEYMDLKIGSNTAWFQDRSDPDHTRRTNIWSGDPGFEFYDQTQERVGYEFERRVANGITVRQKARYEHLSEESAYIDIDDTLYTPQPLAPDEFSRSAGSVRSSFHALNMDNQVEAKFSTSALQHTVLAGVDIGYITFKEGTGYETALPLIDFNYGQQFIPVPPISSVTKQNQLQVGAYLQDQIKLDKWVLTLSGRHDWVSTETEGEEDGNDKALSGRTGLTYLFDSGLAPYIAWGTSFVPNAGTDARTGKVFDPTTAESEEIGVKYLVPGYNASLNAALFNIEQEGGTFYDPNPLIDGYVQRGRVRSRGFEIEGITTLTNGLSLQASYTYVDMKILEGIDENGESAVGNTPSSTPRHLLSVWGYYTVSDGAFRGLGFGSGVRYTGTSFGNDRNTFENGARGIVDAAMHYDLVGLSPQFEGARLQLNVSNVFDKLVDTCSSDYCYQDQGRTILGSLRYRW